MEEGCRNLCYKRSWESWDSAFIFRYFYRNVDFEKKIYYTVEKRKIWGHRRKKMTALDELRGKLDKIDDEIARL